MIAGTLRIRSVAKLFQGDLVGGERRRIWIVGVTRLFLLHHLAEKSFAVTRERTQKAIREAYRALKPGGKLVLMESCLPAAWEWAERLLFPLFRFVVGRMGHPIVFQWNWNRLAAFAREAGFERVDVTRVPRGKWIIQLGHRWPTALTPVRMCKIVAHKPAK